MDFLTSRSQQWDAGFVSHYLGWGFISSLDGLLGEFRIGHARSTFLQEACLEAMFLSLCCW